VDLLDTLRSTGAAREFLAEPVDDDVVARILDTARFAPSGGNRQGWHVVVLKDPTQRRALRDLYLPGWRQYLAMRAAGLTPWAPVTDEAAERAAIEQAEAGPFDPGAFAGHLDEVPVLLVVLADLRALAAVDRGFDRYTMAGGASIYPFTWSILLAARAEGLGGVLTTMPIRREAEVKALVGAPDEFVVAGVIALGRPVHQPHRLTRRPVEEFTTVDRFDGASLSAP
jgi:nitroreductase